MTLRNGDIYDYVSKKWIPMIIKVLKQMNKDIIIKNEADMINNILSHQNCTYKVDLSDVLAMKLGITCNDWSLGNSIHVNVEIYSVE